MTTLQTRAMLANLTIHQWTARKTDKKVAKQVEAQHGAVDAGRYNKLLVNKQHLEPIARAASKIRDYHYERTLPWGDNGDRLLPSSLFFEYTQRMRALKDDFQAEVVQFGRVYPTEVTNARTRLGTMYDPNDYPTHITDRFDIELSFLPVPDATDFRVDVGVEQLDEIKQDITRQLSTRQIAAVQNCWVRLGDCVGKIKERMSETDPIFRDSLITNLKDLLDLIPAFNITDDPDLIAICKEIEDELIVSPSRLRTSWSTQANVFNASSLIKEKIDARTRPA